MNDGTGEKSSNEDDVGREAIGQLLLSLVAYATVKTDLYRFFGHEVKRFLNLNLVISYLPKKECSDDEFTNEVHRRIPA